ncbi:MAG: hypothetical protein V3R25_05645 [Nitrosomonadaceae bacterium]
MSIVRCKVCERDIDLDLVSDAVNYNGEDFHYSCFEEALSSMNFTIERPKTGSFSCDDFRQWWFELMEYDDRTHEDYNITHLPLTQIVEKARREGYTVRLEITEVPKPMNEAEARYLQENKENPCNK